MGAEEEKERLRLKGEIENAEARAKALSMTLPAADKVRLDSTPATVLMPSAIKSGTVSKEGTAKVKGQPTAFQERLFILWRHPDLIAGEYHLIWYDNIDSLLPNGHEALKVGNFTVAPPKSARKGYPNILRLENEERKFILAMSTPEEKKDWMEIFEKIVKDAPGEIKRAAEKAASGSPLAGKMEPEKGKPEVLEEDPVFLQFKRAMTAMGNPQDIMEMPCSLLLPGAKRSGWLRKEGSMNKAFKRRYFVIWELQPTAVLVYYEGPQSQKPNGFVALEKGAVSVGKPKGKRKNAPHCIRVDGKGRIDQGKFKSILAADDPQDLAEWATALGQYT